MLSSLKRIIEKAEARAGKGKLSERTFRGFLHAIEKDMASPRDVSVLPGVFDLLELCGNRYPDLMVREQEASLRVLKYVLAFPNVRAAQRNLLVRWALNPPRWLDVDGLTGVSTYAWHFAQEDIRSQSTLALAMLLRSQRPGLFQRLGVEAWLHEVLLSGNPVNSDGCNQVIAQGLRGKSAIALLPREHCMQLPLPIWQLALLVEAAELGYPSPEQILDHLKTCMKTVREPMFLEATLAIPWSQVLRTDRFSDVIHECLSIAALTILDDEKRTSQDHEEMAVRYLAQEAPLEVVRRFSKLRKVKERGQLLVQTVQSAARQLGMPLPGELPEDFEAQPGQGLQFEVARLLFLAIRTDAEQTAKYAIYLGHLALSDQEAAATENALENKLRDFSCSPLEWDTVAWTVASRLPWSSGDPLGMYRRLLDNGGQGLPLDQIIERATCEDSSGVIRRLDVLCERWVPGDGSERLQLLAYWRQVNAGAITTAQQPPSFVAESARQTPTFQLIEAERALARNDIVAASEQLRRSETTGDVLTGMSLDRQSVFSKLLEKAERWAEGSLQCTGELAALWLLVAGLRRQSGRPDLALDAAVQSVLAEPDTTAGPAAGRLIEQLLSESTLPSRAWLDAARKLQMKPASAQLCLQLIQKSIMCNTGNSAAEADGLLVQLAAQSLPQPLAGEVGIAWARLPSASDPREVARRIQTIHIAGVITSHSAARELSNVPLRLLDGSEQLMWALTLFLEEGEFDAAYGVYGMFPTRMDADTRWAALGRLHEARWKFPPSSSIPLSHSWLAYAIDTQDIARIKQGTEWLVAVDPHLEKDASRQSLRNAIAMLAEGGDIRTAAMGLRSVLRSGHIDAVAHLLRMMLDRGELLAEEDVDIYRETCAGLRDYRLRRDFRYKLAETLQTVNPEQAVRLYAAHYEEVTADVSLTDEQQTELRSLFERIISFGRSQAGSTMAGLHQMEGVLAKRLSDEVHALQSFEKALDLGLHQEVRQEIAEIKESGKESCRCEVARLLVRVCLKLKEDPGPTIREWLTLIEETVVMNAMAEWQTKARVILQEAERAAIETSRKSSDERKQVFDAWVEDLGRPPCDQWGGTRIARCYEALVTALDANRDLSRLDWLAARLKARAGSLPKSLAIELLRRIAAGGKKSHARFARELIDGLQNRLSQASAGVNPIDVRDGLRLFVDFTRRMKMPADDLEVRLVIADLEGGDLHDALRRAESLLYSHPDRRAPLLIAMLGASPGFLLEDRCHSEMWEFILDLYSKVDEETAFQCEEAVLSCLRLLAKHTTPEPGRVDLLRKTWGRFAKADSSQHRASLGEMALAGAILRIRAGRGDKATDEAKELLLAVLGHPEQMDIEPPLFDPLEKYGIERPRDRAMWPATLLKIVEATALLPNNDVALDRDTMGFLAILKCHIALHTKPPLLEEAKAAIEVMDRNEYREQADKATMLLIDLTEGEDEASRVKFFQARRLLRNEAGSKDAAFLVRGVVGSWPKILEVNRERVDAARDVIIGAWQAGRPERELTRLLLDLELTRNHWAAVHALLSLLSTYDWLDGLQDRLIWLVREQPALWPTIRRCRGAAQNPSTESLPNFPLLLETAPDAQQAKMWRDELALLISEFPDNRHLRELGASGLLSPAEQATHCWTLITSEGHDSDLVRTWMGRLRNLSKSDSRAAYLYGRSLLHLGAQGLLEESDESPGSVWERLDAELNASNPICWQFLPQYASFCEKQGQLDRAHSLKLREARDIKVVSQQAWREVVRLWRLAREAEIAAIGEPVSVQEVIHYARVHRLLMRPEPPVQCLQAALKKSSGAERGCLLLELGRVFALLSRYDLAEACHQEAAELLDDSDAKVQNLFEWAVSLSYLQEMDKARILLRKILVMDADHVGARSLLGRLDVPDGLLQIQQMLELSFRNWGGILDEIRGHSV
jgi:tetratricopeptide (TPR) repeat protein